MLQYEHVKLMIKAHEKGDYITFNEQVEKVFLRLHMYKSRENFNDILKDSYEDFRTYLERWYFYNKKFILESLQIAARTINHIAGKHIINSS